MIECRELKIWYPVRSGILNRVRTYIRAVDGVSLAIGAGETLGLVGESGCGKTTLGRAFAGLERPVAGELLFQGEKMDFSGAAGRKRRREIQMIFQDPFSSLDPRMCAMDIVTEGLPGLKGEEKRQRAAALLEEVGLPPEALLRYPHEFSGGQRQRLSIARALACRPRFVVCDEPVSALDVSVQAQNIRLLVDLREKYALSYLFISHDLSVVRLLAQRVAVMYLGHIVETGGVDEVFREPQHPYTQALLAAIPVPGAPRQSGRIVLQGEVPSPGSPPSGCPFRTRCPRSTPECAKNPPALRKIAGEHFSACCVP